MNQFNLYQDKMILNLILSVFYGFYLHERSKSPQYNFSFSAFLKNYSTKKKHEWLGIPLNKAVCHENLSLIHKIFKEHNIFFWLSEGTALGFVRDHDFISYDDDVDIGVRKNDLGIFQRMVIPKLEASGFELCQVALQDSFYVFVRKGEKVDVDFTGENLHCMSINKRSCDLVLPHLQEFDQIVIRGLVHNVPKESYLRFLYGDDWRIPQRKKPQ